MKFFVRVCVWGGSIRLCAGFCDVDVYSVYVFIDTTLVSLSAETSRYIYSSNLFTYWYFSVFAYHLYLYCYLCTECFSCVFVGIHESGLSMPYINEELMLFLLV